MLDKSISDLIFSYVIFPKGTNNSGWSKCYCEVCGDGSRKKGPRGGWAFDGDAAFYRCFNCGIDANFDPNREHPFSKNMRKVLDSFGIPAKEYNAVAYANKLTADNIKSPEKKNELSTKYFSIPDHFYLLKDASLDNVIANNARKFLREHYALTQNSHSFYLSTGESDKPHEKGLAGRLIIPYFKNGKLIYYQARALDDSKPKYLNMDTPKKNVVFNMDQLYKNLERPLYVFEGAFDAIHANGIAVMENNMTTNQIEILNKSPRRKVVVPDRGGDSRKLVDIALENDWGISLPELGSGSKDLCEGIIKFGKLHVINSMVQKTYFGKEAKIRSQFI